MLREGRQEGCDALEVQVVVVLIAISTTLEEANLVVEVLDDPEGDLVLGSAVRDDALPVPLDHVRKAFVGSEALPFQAVLPPIEEGTSLERIGVVPELAEGLFEYVGPRPNAKQLPLS